MPRIKDGYTNHQKSPLLCPSAAVEKLWRVTALKLKDSSIILICFNIKSWTWTLKKRELLQEVGHSNRTKPTSNFYPSSNAISVLRKWGGKLLCLTVFRRNYTNVLPINAGAIIKNYKIASTMTSISSSTLSRKKLRGKIHTTPSNVPPR